MALNQLGLGMVFTATDLASGVMKKLEGQFSQTRNEVGQFQTANKDMFSQFATGASIMGAGLVTMGAFAPAMSAAADFEQQIANIRTVIDEAALSTDDARAATMKLAATYGGDAVQQANALYETISAGVTDATEATQLLEVANKFAVGGSAEMAQSIDVLTSAVNVYREQGLTAAQASDVMFTAIAAGKTTAAALSQSLGEVAPSAQAAGISFSELNGAIATLTVQGIRTPQAVTGMNAMLSNMMKPSKDAADEAKRLGIEWDSTALKSKGLQGMLKQLSGNTKVNNDTMINLFGSIDGIKAALALTSNGGKKFDEVLQQMSESVGATDKAFGIMSGTTKFQASRFMALAKNALILIGDAIEPLTGAILKFGNDALEAFGNLPGPLITLAARGVFLAGALATLVGALTAARGAAGLALPALRMLGVSGFGAIATAVGPALVAIAAGAAVIYAFKYAVDNNLGGIADTFNEKFGGVRLAFDALKQLFMDGGFSGEVREEFLKGGNPAIEFAKQVYVVANRVQAFLQGMGEGFSAVMDRAGPSFEQFTDALQLLGNALGLTSTTAKENGDAFDAMIGTGASFGQTVAGIAVFLVDTATAVIAFAAGVARMWDRMSEPYGRLWSSIGQVFSAVGQLISALTGMGGASDQATADWVTMGERIGGVIAGIAGVVGGVVSGVAGLIAGLAEVVRGTITMVVGLLSGDGAQAWAGFKQAAFGAISGIMEALGGLLEAVASAVDSLAALGGQDLGLGKKVSGFREMVKQEAAGLRPAGASVITSAPSIGPPAASGLPSADAVYAQGPGPSSQGLQSMEAAFSKIAKMESTKPSITNQLTVRLDGAEIAAALEQSQAGGFGPTAPAM
jgi:TP901 family phage tail tape measure protein